MKYTLLILLFSITAVSAQEYSGPKCLGPYCIDRNASIRSMFNRIGAERQSAPNLYCYAEGNRAAFLYFETIDSEPHIVGDVFLSASPNCVHMPVHRTAAELHSWKTREGISLGSAEAAVLKAYGKPTSNIMITGALQGGQVGADTPDSISMLRIRGFQTGDNRLVAERRLFYNSENMDDPSAAEFGIRDGKVVWIFLSDNE
jgi:hypothetical protein